MRKRKATGWYVWTLGPREVFSGKQAAYAAWALYAERMSVDAGFVPHSRLLHFGRRVDARAVLEARPGPFGHLGGRLVAAV